VVLRPSPRELRLDGEIYAGEGDWGRAEPSAHGQARAARYHLAGFRSDPDHDAGGCGAERDQPVQIVGALVRGGLGGAVGTTAAVTAALSRGAAGLSGGRRRLERQAKR
jgi:hypothetical protein